MLGDFVIGKGLLTVVFVLLLSLTIPALGQDGSISITTSKSGYTSYNGGYPSVGQTGSATTMGSYSNGQTNTIIGGLGLQIIDHSMASQVDEKTGEVISRARTFSATTNKVYSWLKLGTIDAAHQVEWRWISPDGRLYYSYVDWIPKPDGGPLDSVGTFSYISVDGEDAANMPGKWHVDIFLDGDDQKSLTEQFTIFGQAGELSSGAATGSMKAGCHTDPTSGNIICVDTVGDFSNPAQNVQGGCYRDPATGQVICIDTGDLSGEGGIGEQI